MSETAWMERNCCVCGIPVCPHEGEWENAGEADCPDIVYATAADEWAAAVRLSESRPKEGVTTP